MNPHPPFLRDHLPAIVWAVGCAVAMWTPASEMPRPPVDASIADPAAHLALFFVLALLTRRSFARLVAGRPAAPAAFVAVAVWVVVLELGQLLVPGRGWQTADVLLGLLGGGAGLLLARFLGGR